MSILVPAEPKSVLVADALCLRREGTLRLLQEWGAAHDVALCPFDPVQLEAPGFAAESGRQWVLSIINLGGVSVDDSNASQWISGLLTHFAGAPLVILSDRGEDDEPVNALRLGAQGFIHTSIAPDVAMSALSFIMGGGTFFPPGALIARSPRTGISGRLFGRRRPRAKGSTESRALPGLHCIAWPIKRLQRPGPGDRRSLLERFMRTPKRLPFLR